MRRKKRDSSDFFTLAKCIRKWRRQIFPSATTPTDTHQHNQQCHLNSTHAVSTASGTANRHSPTKTLTETHEGNRHTPTLPPIATKLNSRFLYRFQRYQQTFTNIENNRHTPTQPAVTPEFHFLPLLLLPNSSPELHKTSNNNTTNNTN